MQQPTDQSVGQKISVLPQYVDIALVAGKQENVVLPCNGLWSAHAKCYI